MPMRPFAAKRRVLEVPIKINRLINKYIIIFNLNYPENTYSTFSPALRSATVSVDGIAAAFGMISFAGDEESPPGIVVNFRVRPAYVKHIFFAKRRLFVEYGDYRSFQVSYELFGNVAAHGLTAVESVLFGDSPVQSGCHSS